ncbi:MAG: hypothetical protein HKO93_01315, partial [Flavobacteriales bacterium]|nr:hypothetical protein [Flavobacteriales bacterium]
LSLFPGAVIDIYGIENDSIFLSAQCKSPESFGNLTLNIDLPEPAPYILEMLDSQRQLQYEIQVEDDYTWNLDYLEPGAYVLRIYVDSDMNGRWSEGDFINEINPEPVFMLQEPITVRSNWEMDQDIKVQFKQ